MNNDYRKLLEQAIIGQNPEFNEYISAKSRKDDTETGLFDDFAYFIFGAILYKKNEAASSALRFIESIYLNGEIEIAKLLMYEVIENLQNYISHHPEAHRLFFSRIGPETKKIWETLIYIWRGKSKVSELIREEKAGKKSKLMAYPAPIIIVATIFKRWKYYLTKVRKAKNEKLMRIIMNMGRGPYIPFWNLNF